MGDAFFNQEEIMSKELAKTYDPKGLEDRLYQKWMDNGYLVNVEVSPNIISFMRARVIAAFIRRKSLRKQICLSSFARTKLMRMTSCSCPTSICSSRKQSLSILSI